MNKLQYTLYSFAAALMAAANTLKESADNVPNDADEELGETTSDDTPAETTAAVATTSEPPAFDSAGLPWDERIHSSKKTIKGDGTWIKRKGTPPTTIATVEAELRAKLPAAPLAGPAPIAAPAVPTAPTVPSVPVVPTAAPVALTNYQKLCAWCAANTGEGKAAPTSWVDSTLAAQGTSLAALATDEGMSAAWLDAFKKALGQA